MGFLHPNLKKFSTVIVRLILLLSLTGLKFPTDQKQKIELSKPLFDDENNVKTAFTLTALLSGFHNIPKALSRLENKQPVSAKAG